MNSTDPTLATPAHITDAEGRALLDSYRHVPPDAVVALLARQRPAKPSWALTEAQATMIALADLAKAPVGAVPDAVTAPTLTVDDFNEAARFIERLTGESHETTRCWFQTFDDGPEKNPALAQVCH